MIFGPVVHDLPNHGYTGIFLYLAPEYDALIQSFTNGYEAGAQSKSGHHGERPDQDRFGADRFYRSSGRIYDTGVGNGRVEGQSCLLSFLKEEGVDAVLDTLLSADLHQLPFLGGKCPENVCVAVAGIEQIASSCRQVLTEVFHI